MSGYTCPRCGWTSYHPDDKRYGYCGNCHDHTHDEKLTQEAIAAYLVRRCGLEELPGRGHPTGNRVAKELLEAFDIKIKEE